MEWKSDPYDPLYLECQIDSFVLTVIYFPSGRWFWKVWRGKDEKIGDGYAKTKEAAQQAAARRLRDWRVSHAAAPDEA